jgi:hypothetical protein
VGNRGGDPDTGRSATERALFGLAASIKALARRVQRIEQSNRGVPPHMRFDMEQDDDGCYLVVENVRTGNRERITGPL